MGIDEANNSLSIPFNIVLCHTNELHIVVVQPFGIPFVQGLLASRLFLVTLHQRQNPFPLVLAFSTIRRISNHHHYRAVAFDNVRLSCLAAEPLSEERTRLVVALFERVGQVDAQAFVRLVLIACFREQHVKLYMGDGIGGHQNLETIQARQQMLLYILLPYALVVAITVVYLIDNL